MVKASRDAMGCGGSGFASLELGLLACVVGVSISVLLLWSGRNPKDEMNQRGKCCC